jgi:prepilin-type processing-associated H-X9-DG protein
VVQDNSGTILLGELASSYNIAGNTYPVMAGPGPTRPPGAPSDYYIQTASGATAGSYGMNSYALHGGRFNYLFHDGHVQALKTTETIGTGTLGSPKGMWTMTGGD